jgi:hypothetical protein
MHHTTSPTPILLSVRAAQSMIGIGRTKLYELLHSGELNARRLHGRTLVETASIEAYVRSLPMVSLGQR